MKRTIISILAALSIFMSLFALTACKKGADSETTEQGITTPDIPIEDEGTGDATGPVTQPTLPVNPENGGAIELPEVEF